ncbi:CDP-diacylglycerol--glycerol-3-phosphate 3-phosphatidyltransferase [Pleurotus ostreatus]|uniref:CDP-diacylglycerol--glycerol-3-phosphate 3-phosphatidyltransferase n=1 Tax=Pleurotus ostreatus TaxID=5322 RepID=A0A8H7A5E5_PLEOS|nr:CDP-diacylglycerol--glycerol-3-phosphate 3-phosphatidyltransferase [Pleurotus ostreatus]KAF7440281.1 CDP-diacylglycerol--glycerol-3-phosphate 3-phosphatidyltransferase [Pleurotus ostreatus]
MFSSLRPLCRRSTRFAFWATACETTNVRRAHSYHPLINGFVSALQREQPCLAVSPRRIQVLSQPSSFYETLLAMIQRAKSRIFISSLYIGSGESQLIGALEEALTRSPDLKVFLQLDLNRSTRPGKLSTAHLLLPLLEKFPSRVSVSLFRSPSLRGVLAKVVPPRFNEGWGTWHAKIYGADDEVMISGANLNDSYFTDRQDRYIHFDGEPQLADYCFSFLRTVSTFSFQLSPATHVRSSKYSYRHEDYTLDWPDASTHPHEIQSKAADSFTSFQAHQKELSISRRTPSHPSSSSEEKVLLFPIIQAGQFGIREEESSLDLLFRHVASHSTPESGFDDVRQRPLMDLTSGYFGLNKRYQDLVLSSRDIDCRIICASPKANGFYGSSGISGRIPEGYTYLEQGFMKAVKSAGRTWTQKGNYGHGVQLKEWYKDGWTYHAKGIWLSPNPDAPPVLTLFGSTNLNSRSSQLDTELSFIMALPSKLVRTSPEERNTAVASVSAPQAGEQTPGLDLRQELHKEISRLHQFTGEWQGGARAVRWGTMALVHLVGGML